MTKSESSAESSQAIQYQYGEKLENKRRNSGNDSASVRLRHRSDQPSAAANGETSAKRHEKKWQIA